jgi:hypothetical protein
MALLTKHEAAKRVEELVLDGLNRLAMDDWPGALSYLEEARGKTAAITAMPVRARKVPTLPEGGRRYSSSLQTGLAILAEFPNPPGEDVLGIAEVADRIGRSRSTVHRYMITLVALGQLEQTVGRKYRRPEISS